MSFNNKEQSVIDTSNLPILKYHQPSKDDIKASRLSNTTSQNFLKQAVPLMRSLHLSENESKYAEELLQRMADNKGESDAIDYLLVKHKFPFEVVKAPGLPREAKQMLLTENVLKAADKGVEDYYLEDAEKKAKASKNKPDAMIYGWNSNGTRFYPQKDRVDVIDDFLFRNVAADKDVRGKIGRGLLRGVSLDAISRLIRMRKNEGLVSELFSDAVKKAETDISSREAQMRHTPNAYEKHLKDVIIAANPDPDNKPVSTMRGLSGYLTQEEIEDAFETVRQLSQSHSDRNYAKTLTPRQRERVLDAIGARTSLLSGRNVSDVGQKLFPLSSK